MPLLVLLYVAIRGKNASRRNIAQGILVSYITILMLFTAGEAYFRYVHAESGWEPTLAHKNWRDKYWHLNSDGFRDREWQEADWQDKTTISIVGDSFASGWGVKNPEDRFTDVLASHLGAAYYVRNLALPGTSTPQHLEILQEQQPPQPDIVILQYFLNDSEYASATVSRNWEGNFAEVPPRLIEESYLLNYIFWLLFPQLQQVDMTFEGSYWDWQYSSYDNEVVREFHWREIEAFI
ncbi:MAG: SGNH/GDSL hydrolase family protein, partial [Aggregatilineales bacterium]